MAKVPGKGSVLQLEIATVFTAIGQVISIDGPEADVGTYNASDLSTGVGEVHEPTGYAEPGMLSFEIFFDPVLATHQALTDLILAPDKVNWKEIFADDAATVWPFAGILKKFGTSVKKDDGVKASAAIQLSGLPTYPT